MQASSKLEQTVADLIPHDTGCAWEYYAQPEHYRRCTCGADAKRNKLLLHVNAHIDQLTRGRVYLDRNAV